MTGIIMVRPTGGLVPTSLTTKRPAVSQIMTLRLTVHTLSVISRQLKKSITIGSQGFCRSGEGSRSYWRKQFPVAFLETEADH